MKIRNALSATLIRFAHSTVLFVVALSMCCLPSRGYANAHCFCTLGPPSSPVKNFGEIDSYNTQIGHDARCNTKCNGATESYMSNSSNRASACTAAKGVSIVTYSSVGTKKYQTGTSFSCPQTSSGPQSGAIGFPDPVNVSSARKIYVNDTGFYPSQVSGPLYGVSYKSPFVTFKLEDRLGFHAQSWTYDATLYRDNVLVERLSGKSPAVAAPGVSVTFTSQATNSVRGHTWKIAWHYTGKGLADGSVSFFLP